LRVRELRFEGISVDARGMVPAALDEVARRKDARLVVLQPTVHNPTAAQMDLERRREIVAVARAHDLTLIEDDVYGQLPADRPPPLAA
ncbi:aminotransferase class I/II-fold pyridoxal phosphate-dependent enzyme, partial [Acinetobacter baumannii]